MGRSFLVLKQFQMARYLGFGLTILGRDGIVVVCGKRKGRRDDATKYSEESGSPDGSNDEQHRTFYLPIGEVP